MPIGSSSVYMPSTSFMLSSEFMSNPTLIVAIRTSFTSCLMVWVCLTGTFLVHFYVFLIEGKIRCNSYKAKNSLLLSESFFEELLSILFVKCRNFQKRKRFFPEKYATQTCKFNFLQSRCLLHIFYISFVTCSYVNLKKFLGTKVRKLLNQDCPLLIQFN